MRCSLIYPIHGPSLTFVLLPKFSAIFHAVYKMNEARRKQTNCQRKLCTFRSFRFWKSGNAIFCKVRQEMQPTAADFTLFFTLYLFSTPSYSLTLSHLLCESIPLLVIKLHLNFFYLSFSSIPVDCPLHAVCCVFFSCSLLVSLSFNLLLILLLESFIVSLRLIYHSEHIP